MKLKIFIFVCSIGLTQEALFAVDYYFSNSEGNDAWSGTLPSPNATQTDGPKQTLAAAQSFIPTVQAGDRVLFKRGDVWNVSSGFGIINHRGIESNPVVIGSYGTGARPRFAFSQGGIVVRSQGAGPTQYLEIRDISIYRNNNVEGDTGFYAGEGVYTLPHHLLVSNIEVDGLFASLLVNYAPDSTYENSLFHNSLSAGFFNAVDNVTIRNNVLENIGDRDTMNYFVHVFYLFGSGLLVEGNTVRDCHDAMKVRGARNSVIRNNLIYDCEEGGIHAGGDNQGNILQNVVFEGNTIYETGMGILIKGESGPGPAENIIVRNNIIHSKRIGSGGGLFSIGDAQINGLYVYNNLFFDPRQNPVINVYTTNPQNLVIRNNIAVNTDFSNSSRFIEMGSPSNLNGITFSNNLYSGSGAFMRLGNTNYPTLASFQQANPTQEQQSILGNPSFVSVPGRNFHLNEGSIGIDQGYDVNTAVPMDFDGVNRPQGNGYDIGPFEYSSETVPNVRPQVNAGVDQSIPYPGNSVNLSGTVSDDGFPNPPGQVTIQWSRVSGSGVVTFGNVLSPATSATFSQPGTYILRLSGNDGALTGTDDVQVAIAGSMAIEVPSVPVYDSETKLLACSNPREVAQSGTVTICFQLTKRGPVKVRIFGRRGKEVAVVCNEERSAGFNSLRWDTTGQTSGTYYVVMEFDGASYKAPLSVIK